MVWIRPGSSIELTLDDTDVVRYDQIVATPADAFVISNVRAPSDNRRIVTLTNVRPIVEGNLNVQVKRCLVCVDRNVNYRIIVVPDLTGVDLLGPSIKGCENDAIVLSPAIDATYYHYVSWSTQDSTRQFIVRESGIYGVTVKNALGESWSDEVSVTVNPNPIIKLGISTAACLEPQVTLDAGRFTSYLWSNGQTSRSVVTRQNAEYTLNVTDSLGCHATAKMYVNIPAAADCGSSSPIAALTTSAACSEFPLLTRRWKITNPNTVALRVDWAIDNTIQKTWLDVPPGESYLTTLNVPNKNHKLILNWHNEKGVLQTTTATTIADKCSKSPSTAFVGTPTAKVTNVFPNPSIDQVTVEINNSRDEITTLQIFTLSGTPKRSQQIQLGPGTNFISQNIADLERGVYILKVNGETVRFTKE